MDQENSFQWGIFIFLTAGKLTFLGGGITSKLQLVTILGHIQACPTRFLAQKTFVILKKVAKKKAVWLCLMWHTHIDIHDIEKMVMVAKL